MATEKFFWRDVELQKGRWLNEAEFMARFPQAHARRFRGEYAVGLDADGILRPAERYVFIRANPSRHACDARCLYATGRTMQCECSCGGKNHGRGHFVCNQVSIELPPNTQALI